MKKIFKFFKTYKKYLIIFFIVQGMILAILTSRLYNLNHTVLVQKESDLKNHFINAKNEIYNITFLSKNILNNQIPNKVSEIKITLLTQQILLLSSKDKIVENIYIYNKKGEFIKKAYYLLEDDKKENCDIINSPKGELIFKKNEGFSINYPLYKNGKVIGYIKYSIDSEYILNKVNSFANSKYTFLELKNKKDKVLFIDDFKELKQSSINFKDFSFKDLKFINENLNLKETKAFITNYFFDRNIIIMHPVEFNKKIQGYIVINKKCKILEIISDNYLILITSMMLAHIFFFFIYAKSIKLKAELNKKFRKADKDANYDYLTGIYNRRAFFIKGESIIHNAIENNKHVHAAMLDIDYFKNINDTYGHEVGDVVLKETAKMFKLKIDGKENLYARLGGEEFALLLIDKTDQEVEQILESFKKSISDLTIHSAKGDIKITISIGYAFYGENITSIDSLLKNADKALYESKENGRNKVSAYLRDKEKR